MKFNIESCNLNTHFGEFELTCFNYGSHEDENILCLTTKWSSDEPIVRIQSACFTSEIFRSKDCDCHEQLEYSIEQVHKNGGLVIYMLQDGRGAGIYKKVCGLKLGETKGLNTAEAYDELGISRDPRQYKKLEIVFQYFGIRKLKLLTNNPRKIKALEDLGINVSRMSIEIPPTKDSENYLRTKKEELGHLFSKYI